MKFRLYKDKRKTIKSLEDLAKYINENGDVIISLRQVIPQHNEKDDDIYDIENKLDYLDGWEYTGW